MRPEWEKGLRGSLYALGRRIFPLSWRRAVRRRIATERLFGIRKPEVELPRYDFDPDEARPGRPDFVFLPVIAWSYRRQRPQQLAEALARRGRRVFYGAIRGPGEPSAPTGVAPGVTLLPIAGVRREDPGDRRLSGGNLAAALESLEVARREFGLFEAALVVESPFWAPLARAASERFGWKVVYDCLDAHASFGTNRADLLSEAERDLLASADLAVATSEVLRERIATLGKEARLLPNACDFSRFGEEQPLQPDGRPARDPGALTVGYVGAVDEWFDDALLAAVARLRPAWTFEVVGGVESPRAPAGLPGNVRFLGERSHAELPALRAGFDVEIIPFRLSELTHAVDPVKLYEAAAAARPVVATRLRSLESLARSGVVRLAATADEFAAAIEAAAAEPEAEKRARRQFARENTWDHRAADLEGWVRDLYPIVSIVLVTHDGIDFTRLCLESLERRTDWPRTEAIVVDNGSTDGTREWLEAEAGRRPDLRVVAFPDNRGFAPAANAGAEAARGELLCFLNNDTVVTRGWLSALVRHLEADPGLGMVGPSTNEIANAAKVPVGYREPGDLEAWARRFSAGNAGRREEIEMLALFCALIRRPVFAEIGRLDERFAVGMFEDDDYSRRLREGGYRLAVVRDAFVHHWGRGSFRALGEEEYRRIFQENQRRFDEKWGRSPRT